MSYARKSPGHSDVYVYGSLRDLVEPNGVLIRTREDVQRFLDTHPTATIYTCHECALFNGISFECMAPESMIAHLLGHRTRGHLVPDAAVERLHAELNSVTNQALGAGIIEELARGLYHAEDTGQFDQDEFLAALKEARGVLDILEAKGRELAARKLPS